MTMLSLTFRQEMPRERQRRMRKGDTEMMMIDGAAGEGGGQILRSALALSLATGKAFEIRDIRAGRAKPGLMRQHLACVRAAAAISGAEMTGDELGSQHLAFAPGTVRAGSYDLAIGTAGSTGLVLQTIMLPLALARETSVLTITGGTHNQQAPSFDFLDRAYLPQLRRMGFTVSATLTKTGFYPAGGGVIEVTIAPAMPLQPLLLVERGPLQTARGVAVVANLSRQIGERELSVIAGRLGWPAEMLTVEARQGAGPGNCVMAFLDYGAVSEVFTAFGRQGVSAERVGHELLRDVQAYLSLEAPVGPYLADQLLLPMALGAGGRFITGLPTEHTLTHRDIINRFLGPVVTIEAMDKRLWQVEVKAGGAG